jgi:hypothetical protein
LDNLSEDSAEIRLVILREVIPVLPAFQKTLCKPLGRNIQPTTATQLGAGMQIRKDLIEEI